VRRKPVFWSDRDLDRALGTTGWYRTFDDVIRTPGVEQLAAAIRTQLCAGEAVDLPFGAFDIVAKPAGALTNPDTGQRIEIPAHKLLRFVPSIDLMARIND
jgi:nucleoid DNA-binding protein